jgi:YHS domain-containing protein
MKNSQLMTEIVFAVALVALEPSSRADDTNTVSSVKPDLLKTCPVSGDKLGGDMGKPYVFVYQGQEVKMCCPMCKADFDKDPAKYMAKIRAADKPEKK